MKLRVGQIGIAHDHASDIMECMLNLSDLFEVLGVVTLDEENTTLLQRHYDTYNGVPKLTKEELFALNPDAIVVESSEKNLISTAIECAKRKIHLHIDKPAGMDIDELKTLMDIAKENGLVVRFGYMYRTNPAIVEARRMVENGELGEIYSIHAVMNADHDAKKRAWLKNMKGGIMYFLGCHLVDLVYLFKGKPNDVTLFNRKSGMEGVEAEDSGFAVFDYGNCIATIESNSIEYRATERRQLTICGEKGRIEIKPLEWPTKIEVFTRENAEGDRRIEYPPYARYDKMMEDFYDKVKNGTKDNYDYDYEMAVQKLVLYTSGYDINWRE